MLALKSGVAFQSDAAFCGLNCGKIKAANPQKEVFSMIAEPVSNINVRRKVMPHDSESVGRKGEEIYRRIRAQVETPETVGDFIIIETLTGEWEIVPDDKGVSLAHRLHEKGVATGRYIARIGYKACFSKGGGTLTRRDD